MNSQDGLISIIMRDLAFLPRLIFSGVRRDSVLGGAAKRRVCTRFLNEFQNFELSSTIRLEHTIIRGLVDQQQ